ncbi:MAG: CBS domain-containing protein [Candidatus Cloacimonetes bacterium]|nr:CBS domain-containing protein [Candidatus Cloacimonadota bacterium]
MEFFLVWWATFFLCVKKLLVLTPFHESGCFLEQDGEYTGFTFEESSNLFGNFFNHTMYYLVSLAPIFICAYLYNFSTVKIIYILLVVSLLSFIFQVWFQSTVRAGRSTWLSYLFNLQARIHVIMSVFSRLEGILHKLILGDETYFRAVRSFKESLDFRFSRQQVKADEEDYDYPEKLILNNIEPFITKNVSEVMKELSRVETISSSSTVKDGLQKCSTSGYSRLPVFDEENKDKIIGIFRGNQISLLARREENLIAYMDDICKLYQEMSCYECLRTLQKNKRQLGLIYERDKVVGLVTVEDLLEVFVGKIEDEFDRSDLEKIGENNYLVHGSFDILQLEELLNTQLDKKHVKTLNGFLVEHMKRLPHVGDAYVIGGIEFLIERVDSKQILQVNITKRHD